MNWLRLPRQAALTLVEVLVVVVILAVLMAVALPALKRARSAAGETVCINNLKQIFVAIERHRSEADGGLHGSAAQIGLPRSARSLVGQFGLTEDLFRCPETPNEYIAEGASGYINMWPPPEVDDGGQFERAFSKYGGKTVILIDMNHNPKTTPYHSIYDEHFGIGITLDGSIVRRKKIGDWNDQSWWQD